MNKKIKDKLDKDEISVMKDLLKQSLNQIGINDITSITYKNEEVFDFNLIVKLRKKCQFDRLKILDLLKGTSFSDYCHKKDEKEDEFCWEAFYFDDEDQGTNRILVFGFHEYDQDFFDFDNDDNDGNGYFDDDDNWYPDYETYSDYNDSKPIEDEWSNSCEKTIDCIKRALKTEKIDYDIMNYDNKTYFMVDKKDANMAEYLIHQHVDRYFKKQNNYDPDTKDKWVTFIINNRYLYDSKPIKDVKPKKNESKKDFISRFMKETEKEYPDQKQRLAVAYSYWNKSTKDSKVKDVFTGLQEVSEFAFPEDASYYAILMISKYLLAYDYTFNFAVGLTMEDYIKNRQQAFKNHYGLDIKFEDVSGEEEKTEYYENLPEESHTGYDKKYIATIFTQKEIKFELNCYFYGSGIINEIKPKCIEPSNYDWLVRFIEKSLIEDEDKNFKEYSGLSDYECYLKIVNKLKRELARKSNVNKFNNKYNRSLDSKIKDSKESLRQDLENGIVKFFTEEGWSPEEIKDYTHIFDFIEEGDKYRIEIGAEENFDIISDLCNELNKIVAKYDKDAYFDMLDEGLIGTWVKKSLVGDSIKDNKMVNESIITFINQLENSLKGAYSIATQLEKQIPAQTATTNQETELYNENGKYVSVFKDINSNVRSWYKLLEEYKKELQTAHIVENEILEEFPLKARNALRESENKEQTYKELIEDLKNRYNSIKNKEKYKDDVLKMKKDLDAFYKNTFKK